MALAVGMFSAGTSFATPDDPFTSYTQPANALVMPFNAQEGRVSFLLVSNIAGVSPTSDPDRFIPAVTTHWAYWGEDCRHLADVNVCLTLNDTVVVDPTDVRSIDAGNNPFGPEIDLSGQRGFVVVTAYSTGEVCADSSFEGNLPIDNAIVGSYTLADLESGAALGADAIGLGLNTELFAVLNPDCPADPFERFVARFSDPNFDCHTILPKITPPAIDIQTFNPETLDLSAVVVLSLKEKGGSGPTSGIEVGPNSSTIQTDAVFYDNTEAATSLPNVRVACAEFNSLIPGTGNFIPGTVSGLTAGIFRMTNFTPGIGGNTGRFIYVTYGQAVGQFGAGTNGKYKSTEQ
ncbi:MAG TPA: hypothetical protein VFD92_19610 [Candidatus Binatia bacterium]|nr:hypothetical protein [Candidatus Binatia bacterium]